MINLDTQIDTAHIQKDLQALSKELKDKAVKAGVAKVAASGVKLMKQYAPEDTGELKKSIRRKQLSRLARGRLNIQQNKAAVIAGPNFRGMGRIANVLEGGAKRHEIKPREESQLQGFLRAQGLGGKKSTLLADGKGFFARTVNHPGVKAHLFIKRADEANKSKVEDLFYRGVRDYLKRHNK